MNLKEGYKTTISPSTDYQKIKKQLHRYLIKKLGVYTDIFYVFNL